jgi:hypothetical protein
MDEIKPFMEKNNLLEDIFLRNLCDDLYISEKSVGTKYATMFISARQLSQGNQRGYSSYDIPEDEEQSYQLLDIDNTPYKSSSTTKFINGLNINE